MRASDVMRRNVISVGPEASVIEVARLLLENGISGAPVVDADGRVPGIVSEGDLMRRREAGTERRHSWWLRHFGAEDALAAEYRKTHGLRAKDVMTTEVVQASPDAPIDAVADLLEEHRIKRVPVVRDGKLLGIVSRANLMRVLAIAKPRAEASADDQTIRETLLGELAAQPWAHPNLVNVIVSGGVVHLWGMMGTPQERDAFVTAAERIAGVRGVENYLGLKPVTIYSVG